ncbi:MAG: hypothetical protein CME19_00720 [Gemmatimonadetes bacterium]|nr:hypothetical protein [Gemmatimonadota bacterium]
MPGSGYATLGVATRTRGGGNEPNRMSMPEEETESAGVSGLDIASLWTVSNAFSMLRVVLVVPTLYYIYLGEEYRWYVFWLVMVMVASDILDGTLARARNEVTEWGKIIDPVTDKLAVDTIAALLVYLKGMPLWVAVAVIGRDVLIVVGGILLASRIKEVPSSNIWGKATTCVMAALLLTFAMDFDPPKPILLPLAGFLIAASFVSYAVRWAQPSSDAPGD